MDDFSTLEHASGSASDVPALLAQLTDGNADDSQASRDARGDAFEALYESLVAPGAWYSASLPTMRLIASALQQDRPAFHGPLFLLGDIACGDHRDWLARSLNGSRTVSTEEAACRELLGELAPRLRELLGHDEWRNRVGAAFVLGCCPVGADANAEALSKLLAHEESPWVRGTAVFGLALCYRHGAPSTSILADLAQNPSEHPVVRGLAALGLCLLGHPTYAAPLTGLLDLTLGGQSLRLTQVYWGRAEMGELVQACGSCLGPDGTEALCDRLIEGLMQREDPENVSVELAACVLVFSGFSETWESSDVALPEELSPRQRTVAENLARCPTPIELGYGLPTSTPAIARWLGLTPPGPLEEVVTLDVAGSTTSRPRWWFLKNGETLGLETSTLETLVTSQNPTTQLRMLIDGEDYGPSIPDLEIANIVAVASSADPTNGSWLEGWFEEKLRGPLRSTSFGPLSDYASNVRYGILSLGLRGGLSPSMKWAALVPFLGSHVRVVLERLPPEIRAAGILRNLEYQSLSVLKELPQYLELVPHRTIVEKVLEAINPDVNNQCIDEPAFSELSEALTKLKESSSGIRGLVEEWTAKYLVEQEQLRFEALKINPRSEAISVISELSRFHSRRIIESLLEGCDLADTKRRISPPVKEKLVEALDELVASKPEVKEWIDEWKANHGKEPQPLPSPELVLVLRNRTEHDEESLSDIDEHGKAQLKAIAQSFWSRTGKTHEAIVEAVVEELDGGFLESFQVFDPKKPKKALYDLWIAESDTGAVFKHGTAENLNIPMIQGHFDTKDASQKSLAEALSLAYLARNKDPSPS